MKKVLAVVGATLVVLPLLGVCWLVLQLIPVWSALVSLGVCVSLAVWIFTRRRGPAAGTESALLGRVGSKEGLL